MCSVTGTAHARGGALRAPKNGLLEQASRDTIAHSLRSLWGLRLLPQTITDTPGEQDRDPTRETRRARLRRLLGLEPKRASMEGGGV
jgi:hypothetical protein